MTKKTIPCGHANTVEGCRLCYLYQTDSRYRVRWGADPLAFDVQVACTANGIGDAILGLTACQGLTRTGKRVRYALLGTSRKGAPWELPWIRLFGGYEEVGTSLVDGLPTVWPHETYGEQNATQLARPRWVHYADACGTTAALPAPRLLPQSALEFANGFEGCIVLAPFSLTPSRAWDLSHWLYLERLATDAGRQCVVLDGRTDDKTRTHAFRSPVLRDEAPERVAAVLSGSACYVGNDSGMTHLAGALGVPGIALCAPVRGKSIYGIYPTIRALNGPLDCTGCHWQRKAGWHTQCDSLCASLQSIRPKDVWRVADTISQKRLGIFDDPAADRHLDVLLRPLTDPHPERRETMRAFLARMPVGAVVCETGCQRSHDDWGAGQSTTIFGRALAYLGGSLVSVDNSPAHAAFASKATAGLPVTVEQSTGAAFLAGGTSQYDGVYLDSQDTWVAGYQDNCLEEAKAATTRTRLLLIDDTWQLSEGAWGGKGSLAVPWLLSQGWRIVLQGYQTLLSFGPDDGSESALTIRAARTVRTAHQGVNCLHLGPATGEQLPCRCSALAGRTVPVHLCSVHGECSPRAARRGKVAIRSCAGCEDRTPIR